MCVQCSVYLPCRYTACIRFNYNTDRNDFDLNVILLYNLIIRCSFKRNIIFPQCIYTINKTIELHFEVTLKMICTYNMFIVIMLLLPIEINNKIIFFFLFKPYKYLLLHTV